MLQFLTMKKTNAILILILLLAATMVSCKKKDEYTASAAFVAVNAVVNTNFVLAEFNIDRSKIYLGSTKYITYAENSQYTPMSLTPGTHTINLWNYPDTTAHDAPIKTISFDASIAGMYTLFYTGSKSNTDTMLVKEEFPSYAYSDSSFSIRFLNLAKGSNPVRVELNGVAQPLVTGLAYKARGGWNSFSAKVNTPDYVISFIDQTTNATLFTYTIENPGELTDGSANRTNIWRRKNLTIAMIGDPAVSSGIFALKPFLIRHSFPG